MGPPVIGGDDDRDGALPGGDDHAAMEPAGNRRRVTTLLVVNKYGRYLPQMEPVGNRQITIGVPVRANLLYPLQWSPPVIGGMTISLRRQPDEAESRRNRARP